MVAISLVTELMLERWRKIRYEFKGSGRTGEGLRVIRRCWYNVCFTAVRPFFSKHCGWHHWLAHWLKEVNSAASTKANVQGVRSRTISLSSSFDLCDSGAGHVPSASLHSGGITSCYSNGSIQAVWLCTSFSQPELQYASCLHIPPMLFPAPLQTHSITTQLVGHHTAVTDRLENFKGLYSKKTKPL